MIDFESIDEQFCRMTEGGLSDEQALSLIGQSCGEVAHRYLTLKYLYLSREGAKLRPTKERKEGFYQLKDREGGNIEIETPEQLQYYIEQENIKRFLFKPLELGFLVMDIDRGHSGGGDGLARFYKYLKRENINLPYFQNIESGSFPCYATSPRGGFHLYFKAPKGSLSFKNTLCYDVDILTTKFCTAAGSAKQEGVYRFHGDLNKAPAFPPVLLIPLCKEIEQFNAPPKVSKVYPKREGKASLAKCLEWGKQNATGGNHDIIFSMACRAKREGYSLQETLAAIEADEIHQNRKDKNDTKSCVTSVFERG